MGAEVFIIEDYVFDEEADVVILSIPESVIEARFVYHHNSQSYVSVGFDAYDNNSSMLNLYVYYIYSYFDKSRLNLYIQYVIVISTNVRS